MSYHLMFRVHELGIFETLVARHNCERYANQGFVSCLTSKGNATLDFMAGHYCWCA